MQTATFVLHVNQHSYLHHESNLDIADCIYPASSLGGAVGLERVSCHCTFELVEVDEDEGAYRNKSSKVSINIKTLGFIQFIK